MRKRQRVTAHELNRELSQDTAYQARLRERDASANVVRAEEQRLLEEIRSSGADAESLAGLVQRYAPLSTPIANALLRYLQKNENSVLAESIARALGAAGEAFDPTPLTKLFEQSASDSLRWAIANTFAELRPLRLKQWLRQAAIDRRNGKAREMLALAVARTLPAAEACQVLTSLFEDMPGHVAKALAECGGPVERAFLRAAAARTNGWARKEISDAIKRIDLRIAKSKR